MMRILFLLVFVVGLAVGIGYPYASRHFFGDELGTWRVYDRDTGFKPAEVKLAASDAPVRVTLDLTAVVAPAPRDSQSVLTITAAGGGQTVLARTLNFANASVVDDSPQTEEKIFRESAGLISTLADGDYVFTVGAGDAEEVNMVSVDLVLHSGAIAYDERAQPIGLTAMAVGFIGFVLTMRGRRKSAEKPDSQPPKPRWGRGGTA